MKKIILNIDEKLYKHCLNEKSLIEFCKDCCSEPSIFTKMMMEIIKKIQQNKKEITFDYKKK